jgi:DNA modification methylase
MKLSNNRTGKLEVRDRKISALKPYAGNPRTHTLKQIRQIADSLKKFGWTNPVLIDDDDGIIAGHGRVAAAKLLGLKTVPTIRLGAMTEAERRAYILADNRLAEQAGWDEELLAIELQFLTDAEIDFEVELTGFETADIDRILDGAGEPGETEMVPEPDPEAPIVSQLGDLWEIGKHRILCGDARDRTSFERLLAGESAQMVFADPPYNVTIEGHVSGLGATQHREFTMASGEMSPAEFTGFLRAVFRNLVAFSTDGAIHYLCMDWRHMREILDAAEGIYSELKNLCIWAKTNAGMGSFYRSQHELVFVFKAGRGKHVNNFGLGEKGRHRSNLWTYAGANTFRHGRMEDLAAHPTVKPTVMVADAILDCSKRGGVVLDAFAGSGATLIAAERTGRRGRAIEIDPAYVDVCVRRLEKETGARAGLSDGREFREVAKARLGIGEAV